MEICGLVVAGGQSRRMNGQNKLFLPLGGVPLVARAAYRLAPQVSHLAINMPARSQQTAGWPSEFDIIPDNTDTPKGPLGGILAGLRWVMAHQKHLRYTATVPADAPFFPKNLVSTLHKDQTDAIIVPEISGSTQQLFALWPVSCYAALETFLQNPDNRKVMHFIQSQPHRIISCDQFDTDAFLNINQPDDFARAQDIYASGRYE